MKAFILCSIISLALAGDITNVDLFGRGESTNVIIQSAKKTAFSSKLLKAVVEAKSAQNSSMVVVDFFKAIDTGGHGLMGYADVQVTLTDINDNAPYFEGSPHNGYVEEGQKMLDRPQSVFVMTMTATDHDDPRTQNAKMTHEIVRNKYLNFIPVFRIESDTGKIYAMIELDRENASQRQFEVEVKATDHGDMPKSGTGKAIIRVMDINDSPPYFDNARTFESAVKETAAVNFLVMSLSANDRDDEVFDNALQYSLVEGAFGDLGMRYFYITTDRDISGSNVGTIRVKQIFIFIGNILTKRNWLFCMSFVLLAAPTAGNIECHTKTRLGSLTIEQGTCDGPVCAKHICESDNKGDEKNSAEFKGCDNDNKRTTGCRQDGDSNCIKCYCKEPLCNGSLDTFVFCRVGLLCAFAILIFL